MNSSEKKKVFSDIYKVINENGKRELTFKKMCDIIGVPVPKGYEHFEGFAVKNVAIRYKNATKDCGFFMMPKTMLHQMPLLERLEWLEKVGIKFAFIEKSEYDEHDLENYKGKILLFPVDDVIDKGCKFFSYMKELCNVKTVAVTGTCGKTTTMRFINKVVPEHFNAYLNKGNANSSMAVANNIFNSINPEHEVYIQETGAAEIDSLRRSAQMLCPDAFILLNVFDHHLSDYATFDNLFSDKISFDDYLKDGGVVIANYDDKNIAAHSFKHDVITFGIETEADVDYRAINIEQNEGILDMDIKYKDVTVHIGVSILGTQNAYNVLATFALCKWLGIKDTDIVAGLKKYVSKGYRQNFKKIGGYNLLLDCYNICEDSLKADLKTIKDIHVSGENKRIAVITGENRLGSDAEEKSFELGKSLDLDGIDHVICVGVAEETQENIYKHCHTRPVYEGIKSNGYKNVVYVTDEKGLDNAVRRVVREGDLVLYKGIYSIDLAPSVDRVFGTAISLEEPYYSSNAKEIKSLNFVCKNVKQLKGLDIVECRKKDIKKLVIPNRIFFIPVYRIKPGLFKDKKEIQSLDLGNKIVNIGKRAFYGCSGIKEVTIPASVRVIENQAFARCDSLEKVMIKDGTVHIDENVFANCSKLKDIYIPTSVKAIGKDAFKKCNNITICCQKGSYAEKYTIDNKLNIKYE